MHAVFKKIGKKLVIWLMLLSLAGVCILAGILCYSAEAANHIVINEICSNNFAVAIDENGNYADYVELYNPAKVPVSLTGFSLSDDENNRSRCSLDTVLIPAGGYYTIWVDGSDGSSVGHAEFKLSKNGESIYLSNKQGRIIDKVEVPALSYNTVYAREKDGMEIWVYQTPSQGSTNNDAEKLMEIVENKPFFSVEGGFYQNAFELVITAEEGMIIYYTLDGSNPTIDSLQYVEPILIEDTGKNENRYASRSDLAVSMEYIPNEPVDKATVVRAVSYNASDNTLSDIVTETYFVGFEKKTEYNNYAIISLISDPANLFDEDYGIYGNGKNVAEMEASGESPSYLDSNAMNVGKEWEREAVIQFWDETWEKQINQKVGIRISGQSTRSAAQKSFNVYARDIYDEEDILTYNFFENMPYSSIKIRNGGSKHAESKIMDGFLQELAAERDVSIQAYRPCVVFLNGEYWGLYNIRERYNEEYFQNHYGIRKENIWMLDAGGISIGSYDAWNDFEAVKKYITENDMSISENYEGACELLDIESLIDFYCINLYIDNTDVAFDKNMYVWRSVHVGESEYEDCKWRFMLYDMDESMGAAENNTFINSEWWKEEFDLMDEPIMKGLMKNKEFRKLFYQTFLEIAETTFPYEKVHEELMEWKDVYKIQAVKSHQRFVAKDIMPEDYDGYIKKMDDFFRERPKYILSYLEEEMKCWE